MSTNELYDKFFQLRERQANCTPSERAKLQAEIEKLQREIDKNERDQRS